MFPFLASWTANPRHPELPGPGCLKDVRSAGDSRDVLFFGGESIWAHLVEVGEKHRGASRRKRIKRGEPYEIVITLGLQAHPQKV